MIEKAYNVRDLCNAAIMAESCKKKSEKSFGETIENTLVSSQTHSYIVSLDDEPVSFKDFISFTPGVTSTYGRYYIQYRPKQDKYRDQKRPYVIGQDLLGFRITVSGPRHFGALCNRIPELAWLKRNSNYNDALFRVAHLHPSMTIPFCLKMSEYSEMIEKKAKEKGIDIDNHPFVAYRCSEKRFEEMYSKKFLAPKKNLEDYIDVLNEVDKSIGENDDELK